jgi:hypothetical protein
MGPFVLPTIALVLVVTIFCAWIALDRYDKKHPNQDQDSKRRDR